MTDSTAVPVIVHSASRDLVEALNSLLRRTGLAVHCTWIPDARDIAEAVEQLNPQLLLSHPASTAELQQIAQVRDQFAPYVPLVCVRDEVDEDIIAGDMAHGARDTVSLQQAQRLQAVIQRELHAFRLQRTLAQTLQASQSYRSQLEGVLQRSHEAIAQVQEGILVDANAAWMELFARDDAPVIGHPVMDLFDAATQAPLKAALAACLQGRWTDHALAAGTVMADGTVVPLQLMLALSEYEGETSVRLIVPAQEQDEQRMEQDLNKAVHSDPATGLWARGHLLQLLQERLAAPLTGGVRYLACIRPDKFPALERELGVVQSEQLLGALATLLRSLVAPSDLLGHFGGTGLLVLLERGNARDAEAWCENLIERVGKQAFQIGGRNVHMTCTAGLATVPLTRPDLNAVAMDALEALRRGRERGGNRLVAVDRTDNDTRVQAYDQVWVKHIKAALMENRFRLVQQPIAALTGSERKIFDIAIRMLDSQGKEVLPSEFMPAAARNDLLKNIDRWVIGASLSFVAKTRPDLLFVRLSLDSSLDVPLLQWMDLQLKATAAEPSRLCLAITEEVALRHLPQVQAMVKELRQRGLRFALEHFGTGRDPEHLINALELDFIKIDGSLMQGLSGSPDLQERVRAITDAAGARQVHTVAERVEDANTMAVLWQLGVQYMQGYLVHAPEEVVLKS